MGGANGRNYTNHISDCFAEFLMKIDRSSSFPVLAYRKYPKEKDYVMVAEKKKKGLRIVKKANPKRWGPQKGDITKDHLYQGSGWGML